jgi:hypothetical protein
MTLLPLDRPCDKRRNGATKKQFALAIVVIFALPALLYVRVIGRSPEVIAQKPKDASERTATVASPDRPTPGLDQPPPSIASTGEPAPLPDKVTDLPPQHGGDETIRNATRPDGTYIKIPSVALRTYYLLMDLGGDGEIPTGVKDDFGLTDAEFGQLVEYAKVTLQSDIQYQSDLKAAICTSRSSYQTIEQFGVAANEYALKADTNQESLGRNAKLHLDATLFSKVDAGIRRQGPRQHVSVDFPKFLAVRHRDLQTDIDRFCNSRQ